MLRRDRDWGTGSGPVLGSSTSWGSGWGRRALPIPGEEIPIPTTTFAPIAQGGAAVNPLVSFSYKQVGRTIPRTTDQQKNGLRGIRQVDKRHSDIIIFVNGGDAYHAGIYIGNNRIVHASR